MDRCMDDATMRAEFPDTDQRYAVCQRQASKAYNPASWQTVDRQRGMFRKKYRSQMNDALDKAVKPVFDSIGSTDPNNLIRMADTLITQEPIRQVYRNLYPEVGLWFAKKEFGKAKMKAGNLTIKSPITGWSVKASEEEEILNDIWMNEFIKFVEGAQIGANIKSVTGDSRKLLIKYLQNILSENPDLGSGAQTTMLKDKLKEAWISDSRWRTNRIVRTETTTASNLGNQRGVDATGKNYIRTWRAAFSNTRDDHIEMNGQKREKGVPFDVFGYSMMYPGDPSGPAEQVINCKCTETYELIR